MTAPALSRLRHQLHTEWLHQRGSVLVWCLWLVLRHWQRVTPLSEALAGARIPLNEATTTITVNTGRRIAMPERLMVCLPWALRPSVLLPLSRPRSGPR